MDIITKRLLAQKDDKYAAFFLRLLPGFDGKRVMGVRTPILRETATWVWKNGYCEEFSNELPHYYIEENNLHAFLIEKVKDYNACLLLVKRFLPYVDNWATCDQLRPKAFKDRPELIVPIREWLLSEHAFTVRFAVGMLMLHFSGENFRTEYSDAVAAVCSCEYYVNMMRAWYFATLLAKHYDVALTYLTQNKLDVFTHNRTIEKALDSSVISPARKAQLKTLKRKG